MAKALKGYSEIKRRLKTGKGRGVVRDAENGTVSVSVPNIVRLVDGTWEIDNYVEIKTLDELKAYEEQNQEFMNLIKTRYPSIISRIFKNAYTTLYDTSKKTVASNILNGGVIDYDSAVIQTASTVVDPLPTCRYIVSRVNAENSPVQGKTQKIKPVVRPKGEVLEMLGAGKGKGFFLPEITENGVVVLPTKQNMLSCRFFAVSEGKYSEDQIYEYFATNMRMSESREFDEHDLWRVVEASKELYSIVNNMSSASQDKFENVNKYLRGLSIVNDFCSRRYNPDMSLIEAKYGKKKVQEIEGGDFEFDTPQFDEEDGQTVAEEKKGLLKISVVGGTVTQTGIKDGQLVMTISNDGQLYYEPVYSEDESTVTFVPIQPGN